MAFTLVEVTGTFHNEDGSPANGVITATLTKTIRNSGVTVPPNPVLLQLDEEGHLKTRNGEPVKLLATDDAGTEPAGVLYEWRVQLDNAPTRTFSVALPHAVSPVDFSALEPAT